MSDIAPPAQSADIVEEEPVQKEAAPVAPPEPRVRRLNLIGMRNIFFAISLLIIIPGILSMATKGFLLGIDFAGGTEFTVTFAGHPSLAKAQLAVDAREPQRIGDLDRRRRLHHPLPAAHAPSSSPR